MSGDEVWVLDASALIECKQRIPVDQQWQMFSDMESLVLDGRIAMPRQVIREVSGGTWPDAPGVWAGGMRRKLVHPIDVPVALLRAVLDLTPNVIEANATEDAGDPYVLAMAMQLSIEHDVVIVTEDVVDRLPLKQSLRAAAEAHGLPWCNLTDFASTLGVTCRPRRH